MKSAGKNYLVFFLFCLIAGVVSAESSKPSSESVPKAATHQTIEEVESRQNILDSIDDMITSVERHSRKKYADCIKAFGSEPFCQCIRDKLPVRIDFGGYIQVVTLSKEELKYDTLDKENKELVDKTLEVRDVCVQETIATQK